jgi:hypothetical protein
MHGGMTACPDAGFEASEDCKSLPGCAVPGHSKFCGTETSHPQTSRNDLRNDMHGRMTASQCMPG